jgi:uncharacterized cupredoxin-like copper-binding protein
MRLRFLPLALLAAAVALMLAPSAAPRTTATTVAVTATEFKFVLSKHTVPHGTVVFKVVNRGMLPHNFKISGHKTALIASGKSATLKVTLTKGSKPYLCTVPGHATSGMKGVLKVI